MESPNELTVLNVPALVNSAQQLRIVLEIDRNALADELHPQVTGLSTLELAAKQLMVTDDATNERAVAIMNDAHGRQMSLEAIWKRYKTPLNAARAVVLDMEKKTCGVAEAIKKLASAKSGQFELAQKRTKEKLERQLAVVVEDKKQTLQEEADDLMMSGDITGARAKLLEVEMHVAPTIPSMVTKQAGARVTPKYKGTCEDLMAVIKAIADGRIGLMQEVSPGDSRPLVNIDQVVLNAIVKRQGDGLRIPGIKVEEEVAVAPRGGR